MNLIWAHFACICLWTLYSNALLSLGIGGHWLETFPLKHLFYKGIPGIYVFCCRWCMQQLNISIYAFVIFLSCPGKGSPSFFCLKWAVPGCLRVFLKWFFCLFFGFFCQVHVPGFFLEEFCHSHTFLSLPPSPESENWGKRVPQNSWVWVFHQPGEPSEPHFRLGAARNQFSSIPKAAVINLNEELRDH